MVLNAGRRFKARAGVDAPGFGDADRFGNIGCVEPTGDDDFPIDAAGKSVREGQPLSGSLKASKLFPPLAIDMIEVGESTGALPTMLNSVAEFFEDDVNVRMQAMLSLIEPAIMLVMGTFVAFVLVALYLPIFSLADSIR